MFVNCTHNIREMVERGQGFLKKKNKDKGLRYGSVTLDSTNKSGVYTFLCDLFLS